MIASKTGHLKVSADDHVETDDSRHLTIENIAEIDEPIPVQIAEHLEREVTIAETQQTLRDDAGSEEVDPQRREQMLRSRMREIQAELGEADPGLREVDELRDQLVEANLPPEARARLEELCVANSQGEL